jgi:hypothetical protein
MQFAVVLLISLFACPPLLIFAGKEFFAARKKIEY